MKIDKSKIQQWNKNFDPSESHVLQFEKFYFLVQSHIDGYAVKQYGDKDTNQQWIELNEKDCLEAIRKYRNRIPARSRGIEEAIRDTFKIAHYAQRLFIELCRAAESECEAKEEATPNE